MRRQCTLVCIMCVATAAQASLVWAGDPIGTAFTYQGQLKQGGVPTTDICAFEFSLWDNPDNPSPAGLIGPPLVFEGPQAIDVVNGLFTALLDFGDGAFYGDDRWLEVAVQCSTDIDYTSLWPRQPVTAAPFASYGKQAPWSGLIGIPPDIADGDRDTRLSEAQVENYITDDPIDLHIGTTLNGLTISTGSHTSDTNASTLCTGAEVFLDGNGDCVSVDATGSSLWHTNGSSIYYNTGYVGLGTSSPVAHLDVTRAATNITSFNLANTTSNQRYLFQVNGSSLAGSGRAGNLEIWGTGAPGSDKNVFTATPGGLVGIGTSTPGQKLSVAGRVESTTGGFQFPDGTVQTSAVKSESPWSTNGSNVHYNSGNVGIGTSTPGQKLTVAGRIESTSQGFKFPDGTLQTTATKWTSTGSDLLLFSRNVGLSTTNPAVRLDVGGMARVNGDAWPSTGWGLELAYSVTQHRGFIQAYNRLAGTWGDLYLGNGSVGIGSGLDYSAGKLVVGNSAGIGVDAKGTSWGAHFKDSNGSGEAWLAGDDGQGGQYGIYCQGSKAGGYFLDSDGTAEAWLAHSSSTGTKYGILTHSDGYGGNFSGHYGISASGYSQGGVFGNTTGNGWASVAEDNKKITGNGSMSFVQNHPRDMDRVIVYTAPEGDEAATYTRGTARLVDGAVRVPLGETFKWVTNPDIGLTAHLTPRGDCEGLFVESLTTSEIVVREMRGGASDVTFNYIVYGLRIGFEESSVVEEKQREAYIPSMQSVRNRYEKHPDLQEFNALERFKRMRTAIGETEAVDLGESRALRDAVVEFDPAVHTVERPGLPTIGATPGGGTGDEPDLIEDSRAAALTPRVAEKPSAKDAEIRALLDRMEALEAIVDKLSHRPNGGAR